MLVNRLEHWRLAIIRQAPRTCIAIQRLRNSVEVKVEQGCQLKPAVECHADAYGRTASVSDDDALVTRGTAAVKLNETTRVFRLSSLWQ